MRKWVAPFGFSGLGLLAVISVFSWPWAQAAWSHGGFHYFQEADFFRDQMLVLSLAENARVHGPQMLDPLDREQPVFYNFAVPWTWGLLARMTGQPPWAPAHFLQMLLPVAAFFLLAFLFRRLGLPPGWAGLAATLTFFFEPLFFCYRQYGDHATLLPFSSFFAGPFPDSYGTLCALFSLACFLHWHEGVLASPPGTSWRPGLRLAYAGFAVAAVLAGLFQLLAFVFLFLLVGSVLFCRHFHPPGALAARILPAALGLGLVLLFWLGPPSPAPLWVLALGVAVAFLAALTFSPRRALLLLSIPPFILLPALVGLEMAAVLRSGLDPSLYQSGIRVRDLGVPVYAAALAFLPCLLLLPFAFWRAPGDRQRLFAGLLLGTLAATYNHYFGYNNHPYRFFPMAQPLWIALALLGAHSLALAPPSPLRWVGRRLVTLAALGFALGVFLLVSDLPRTLRPILGPVPADLAALGAALETYRRDHPEAIVLAVPRGDHTDQEAGDLTFSTYHLAPFTAIRFFDSSFLSFQRRRRMDYSTGRQLSAILHQIETRRLPISALVLPQEYRNLPADQIPAFGRFGDLELILLPP